MESRIPSAASSAGLEEIDAAKRRLAAARRWESSTALALESAERRLREHAEDARVHLRSAREDAEEAEAHLSMVERRMETIEAGEATAQRATIEATDDAEEGDCGGNESPARKRQKSRRETEGEADRVAEGGGSTAWIVSPAARGTSPSGYSGEFSSFVFHRHAPPGLLGLSFFVGLRERNALVVRCVSDDSPLSGYVRKHDVVIKFDGVNTEDMDIDAFREFVLTSSNGDRKVTLRRFVDRRNLKLFLSSDGNQSD